MDELVLEFTFQFSGEVAEGISHLGDCGVGLHEGIDKTIIIAGLVLKAADLEQGPGDLPSVDPSPVFQLI